MSLTLQGLVVSVIGFILTKLGIPYFSDDIVVVVGSAVTVIGWVMTYFGRVRQGDVTFFGIKK